MYYRFARPAVALALLSACGGGGSNYAAGNAAFISLGQEIDELSDRADSLPPTELAQTPSGSATFSGGAVLIEGPNLVDPSSYNHLALGSANIVVNFSTQAVGGTLTDFIEVDPAQFEAALDDEADVEPEDIRTANVSGTIVLDAENGTATGTLSRAAGGSASYSLLTGTINLFGPNAEVVELVPIGTAELSSGGTTQAGVLITAEQ